MKPSKKFLETLLGRRLPQFSGTLSVQGVNSSVTIDRDQWGIPHIFADNDLDAWFGLGFCQGQDRCFQLESISRVAQGRMSEWVGSRGLPIDRLARRIGFYRSAQAQYEVLDPEYKELLIAFTNGVNAGIRKGLKKKPHEYVLLNTKPKEHSVYDPICIQSLMSFLLPSNWDSELMRLKILIEDGPESLQKTEAAFPEWLNVTNPFQKKAGKAIYELTEELSYLLSQCGVGGGSNNWVIDKQHTKTGRPILANDPHLGPIIPPQWYLAHLTTPDWNVAGASFVGAPGIVCGHNELCAWGVTAGLVDNVDLYIEEIQKDSSQKYSARNAHGSEECKVLYEKIKIRGGKEVEEQVIITERGPVISPALTEKFDFAISMQATWLQPRPIRGVFGLHKVKNFKEFRTLFDGWACLPLNYVFADQSSNIGWQLIGQPPKRRVGKGLIPLPAWIENIGWEEELEEFEKMPYVLNPKDGFIATANNRPEVQSKCFLGEDWLDGYRVTQIQRKLSQKKDWDLSSTQKLQLDVHCLPWDELKNEILSILTSDRAKDDLYVSLFSAVLSDWNGQVDGTSVGATVFELFLDQMIERALSTQAPRTFHWAKGKGFAGELTPMSMAGVRRTSWIVQLILSKPEGWFQQTWDQEIIDAFKAVHTFLEKNYGSNIKNWRWGRVRPLELKHPFGSFKPFRKIFNLGPIEWGGDANTVAQAAVDPLNPTGNPMAVPMFRMVIDVGAWENSEFVLAGGQSGNPFSPHYSDLLNYWLKGRGVKIAWTKQDVQKNSRSQLVLHSSV